MEMEYYYTFIFSILKKTICFFNVRILLNLMKFNKGLNVFVVYEFVVVIVYCYFHAIFSTNLYF